MEKIGRKRLIEEVEIKVWVDEKRIIVEKRHFSSYVHLLLNQGKIMEVEEEDRKRIK